MWSKIIEFIKNVILLTNEQGKLRTEVERLSNDLTRLTYIVQELSHKIDLLNQAREHDRERTGLLIENHALKTEQKQIEPLTKNKRRSK